MCYTEHICWIVDDVTLEGVVKYEITVENEPGVFINVQNHWAKMYTTRNSITQIKKMRKKNYKSDQLKRDWIVQWANWSYKDAKSKKAHLVDLPLKAEGTPLVRLFPPNRAK